MHHWQHFLALIKFALIKKYHLDMCNRVLLLFRKLPQWNLHVNCHVNGTTFQSRLRFQTGLSSLRVSCKCALNYLKVVPLRALVDGNCFYNDASVYFVGNTSLALKLTISELIPEDFQRFQSIQITQVLIFKVWVGCNYCNQGWGIWLFYKCRPIIERY